MLNFGRLNILGGDDDLCVGCILLFSVNFTHIIRLFKLLELYSLFSNVYVLLSSDVTRQRKNGFISTLNAPVFSREVHISRCIFCLCLGLERAPRVFLLFILFLARFLGSFQRLTTGQQRFADRSSLLEEGGGARSVNHFHLSKGCDFFAVLNKRTHGYFHESFGDDIFLLRCNFFDSKINKHIGQISFCSLFFFFISFFQ